MARYLMDKKEQIRKLSVFPRELQVPRTKRFVIPIIGPRRAGKSFYLYDIILNKLNISDMDFIYLNFEDPELMGVDFRDILAAINIHEEVYGKKPLYIFLDEIQNVPNWQKAVRGLYEQKDYYIFLSGSSSKLLAKEIATSLRGRTISYSMLPLSFKEYLKFKHFELKPVYTTSEENKIKNYLRDYLKFGGFPDIVLERQLATKFFREYLELVIFRDIIERHKIKNIFIIKFLIKALITAFAKEFSIYSVFNTLKSQGVKISKKTLYDYSCYLEDTFFTFFVKKFSYSIKDIELSIPKVYINDPGLINFSIVNLSENFGRLMENVVFLELRRAQNVDPLLEVHYYKIVDKEVDFIIKKNLKVTQVIQVCYDIENKKTKEREIRALLKASKELKCKNLLVITWDYEAKEKINNTKVKFMPLWSWLLTFGTLKDQEKFKN